MFKTITVSFDLKDLEMLKEALENRIERLKSLNWVHALEQNIDEHKQLLIKIDSNLKKIKI